jgi:hypothetical protein
MRMTKIKVRWMDWENVCIKNAFEEKIQLRIIAAALGRTVDSVSKKIKKLNLRRATSKRGRLKGNSNPNSWIKRTSQDLENMRGILKTYAPLKLARKGRLALKESCWVSGSPFPRGLQKGEFLERTFQEDIPFSLLFPLDYVLSKDLAPEKIKRKKTFENPLYVSLRHVEQWAVSEGFYQVEKDLQERGLSFWKEGQYFSKAQILIYVNRIRLERKLQPLILYEKEEDLYAESRVS